MQLSFARRISLSALLALWAFPRCAFAQSSGSSFDELAASARQALDAGRLAEAARLYERALAIRPNWPEGAFNLGGALLELKRYPEAVKALRRATAMAGDRGFGWALLGLAEAPSGQPAEALAHLRKSEDLGFGGNADLEAAVRVKCAELLLSASAYDEAFVQLTPLAKLRANRSDIPVVLGLASLASNQDPSRLSERQRAVAAAAGQAVWAGLTQNPGESDALYTQIFERYPGDPGVHYLRGNYLVKTDIAAAAVEFEKEIAAQPSHWPSLLMLASIQVRQGQAAGAVDSLQRAIPLVPERLKWFCHFELGKANLTAGNTEAAISELAVAKTGRPDDSQTHFLLSQAYRRTGKMAEAQKELELFQTLKARETK